VSELSAKLTFIIDPGHGWLKVPIGELAALGIAEQITMYSFVDGRFVYLEEDVDAGTYLSARREQGHQDPTIEDEYVRYFSREQRRYEPPAAPPPAEPSAEEIEAALRELWTRNGFSQERQDAVLAGIDLVASPEGIANMQARLFGERP